MTKEQPVGLSTALATAIHHWTLKTRTGEITLELREANIFEVDDFKRLQDSIRADGNFVSEMAQIVVDGILVRATREVTEQEVRRILKSTKNSELENILTVLMTGLPPRQGEDNPKSEPAQTGGESSP